MYLPRIAECFGDTVLSYSFIMLFVFSVEYFYRDSWFLCFMAEDMLLMYTLFLQHCFSSTCFHDVAFCSPELVFPPHFLKIVVEVRPLGQLHDIQCGLGKQGHAPC